MRYMMLIYTQETVPTTPEQRAAIFAGHCAVQQETTLQGILRAADPLQPTSTATTVRIQSGEFLVTDGPFAETKEQLAGYYILDCKDLDEAIAWSAKIPTACQGATGCVEIRPLRELPRTMSLA
jgi:hypothetical protein